MPSTTRRGRTPFAYASWANLSEEIEQRVIAGVRRLAPGDWRSGDRLWLIDVVAPYGGREALVTELRQTALAGRTVRTLRIGQDGKPTLETMPALEKSAAATMAADRAGAPAVATPLPQAAPN